jgi:hypothetical protein
MTTINRFMLFKEKFPPPSNMSVTSYKPTRRHNPGDQDPHFHGCEKPQISHDIRGPIRLSVSLNQFTAQLNYMLANFRLTDAVNRLLLSVLWWNSYRESLFCTLYQILLGLSHEQESNRRHILRKRGGKVWSGFIWLIIKSGTLLWT